MFQLDALGPDGAYRTRKRLPLRDVSGQQIGEMSQVPPLFVDRGLAALGTAAPMPADDRVAALTRAGDIFALDAIDGMRPDDYHLAVSRLSGLPVTSVRTASQVIAAGARSAYQAAMSGMPAGAVAEWRDPRTRTGSAVWTRRADVLAVLAAAAQD